MSEQADGAAGQMPTNGVGREYIRELLAAAEPRRRAALGASLCFVAAIACVIALALFGSGRSVVLATLAGAFAAAGLWPLCNRMWRDIAIGMLAPAIGERWGQKDFASGWAANDLAEVLRGPLGTGGLCITSWRSAGTYRDVSYRLREDTIRRKRRKNARAEIRHVLVAEIAVPRSFRGSLELVPRSGGIARRIDDALRRVGGSEERLTSVDPQFDAVFDTLASEGAPVEELLTPAVRRAMLTVADRHRDGRCIARFENGWFTLRLPIRQRSFAMARLPRPMPTLEDEADALWWDLTLPHRLIDALSGNHHGPLR